MRKTQTIFCLLLFLVILFSMNMIFGNLLRETFITKLSPKKLNYKPPARINTLNGNNIYAGNKFLGRVSPQDDQPLFFGFS